MRSGASEVAKLFGVHEQHGANFAEELYPGYPGLVVADGKTRVMNWGFPRPMVGKNGQPIKPKAVNNAREDKLHTSFWSDSFKKRRCLIPVTAWAEAQGETGKMTRTWYAVKGHAEPGDTPFAVAGIWRPSSEWGDVYSMVMVGSCEAMAEVHDRMPVIVWQSDWSEWQTGTPEEAFALCKIWNGELAVDRTVESWVKPRQKQTLF